MIHKIINNRRFSQLEQKLIALITENAKRIRAFLKDRQAYDPHTRHNSWACKDPPTNHYELETVSVFQERYVQQGTEFYSK